MYISPTVGYFVHQNFRPMARSPNTSCHIKPVNSSCNHHWLKPDSFELLWLQRLARASGRKLMGDAFDGLLPLPDNFKKKVMAWANPLANYYDKNTWYYSDLFKEIKAGKAGYWRNIPQKLIINRRIYEPVFDLAEGSLWGFIARQAVGVWSVFDVLRYGWKGFVLKENQEENKLKCYRQALKWTIGSEIGSLGFSLGILLAKGKKASLTTGLFTSVLFSTAFDRLMHQVFNSSQVS